MDRVMKSLKQRPEVVQEVAELLFGDGAWEVSKALTENQKRRQAQVGLASNVVGISAGAAGTKAAYDVYHAAGKPKKLPGKALALRPRGAKAVLSSLKGTTFKHPKAVAGAALGLQVANLTGDAVANRVLARSAKKNVAKRDVVAKAIAAKKEDPKGKLIRLGVDGSFKAAKQAPVVAGKAKEGSKRLKANVGKSEEWDMEVRGEISKVDSDKRQVFGWASIIEMDGKPVVDLQGDYMDVDTIEKAAYDYVQNSRKGGNQHERVGEIAKHVSDLVESFVITDEKKKQMGLPESTPTGWWVGFKVNDDDTWEQVKSGKRKEFSIHGSGVRKNIELDD